MKLLVADRRIAKLTPSHNKHDNSTHMASQEIAKKLLMPSQEAAVCNTSSIHGAVT